MAEESHPDQVAIETLCGSARELAVRGFCILRTFRSVYPIVINLVIQYLDPRSGHACSRIA